MNATQLYEWFEAIETNQEQWFKRCSFVTSGEEYKCDQLKWNEFTAGWIESTAGKSEPSPRSLLLLLTLF